MANSLANERSPYLKQHKNNPVHWMPWGPEALEKAKKENKLIIVSIGYSACHWCHVMERESFEDESIAAIMNEHFVSIKVDREERPDIDQVYMIAVQLMTGRGGWPLHCICLPDGRPIYGGTYYPPEGWKSILSQLSDMWQAKPDTAYEYADRLAKGIAQSEKLPIVEDALDYKAEDLDAAVAPLRADFDPVHGGFMRSPKFPMPSNWDFLLQYGVLQNDPELVDHVHFTLRKMAAGGIYDHVGGGFARYAVDERWHVPHFEKMLYDNAQLVSLFLAAWQQRPERTYLRTIKETLDWVIREMTAENGGFYCALDADSEGVEGKFYTFRQEELDQILGDDAALFHSYFHTSAEGNWEEEEINVLHTDLDADELAETSGFSEEEWESYLAEIKQKLYVYRAQRVRPGLDDKQLTAWNALMLKAFCEAYRILDDPEYLDMALRNAQFIQNHVYTMDGGLLRQPEHEGNTIPGFLDDYACTIEAFISLYEATFDGRWLQDAKRLADYAIRHFLDENETFFYYTSNDSETIVARKHEIMDNVIPSSNSVLFRQLQKLGVIFDEPKYHAIVERGLTSVLPHLKSYGAAYSNWGILLLHQIHGPMEIILSGNEGSTWIRAVDEHYIPNKTVLGGTFSEIPLLHARLSVENKAYICQNRTCGLPIETQQDLIGEITTRIN